MPLMACSFLYANHHLEEVGLKSKINFFGKMGLHMTEEKMLIQMLTHV